MEPPVLTVPCGSKVNAWVSLLTEIPAGNMTGGKEGTVPLLPSFGYSNKRVLCEGLVLITTVTGVLPERAEFLALCKASATCTVASFMADLAELSRNLGLAKASSTANTASKTSTSMRLRPLPNFRFFTFTFNPLKPGSTGSVAQFHLVWWLNSLSADHCEPARPPMTAG